MVTPKPKPVTGESLNPKPDLTPDQALAANPTYAKAHPAWAAMNTYQSPMEGENNMFYNLGSGARNFMQNPHWFTPAFANGAPIGGLAGGALGALAGYAGSKLMGNDNSGRIAMLSGLLGAGLGAATGYNRQGVTKTASDPKVIIVNSISQAPDLNFYQRADLMSAVSGMPYMAADRLAQMIENAGGAIAGASIARFLMNTGLLGTGLGAVVGASAADAYFHPPTLNAAGQLATRMF